MTLWTHREAEAATLGRASAPFQANGLSIDTRTLKAGDLFVALSRRVPPPPWYRARPRKRAARS